MRTFLSPGIFLFTLLALSLSACQGNPVMPGADIPADPSISVQPGLESNHHCYGYYIISADTRSGEFEILPLRTSQWHFNITGILNQTMGVGAVGVPSEADPLHGRFVLDITLTHPFATKPQFAGFDVKGILMTPGTLTIGNDIFADLDEIRLLNADGYTRWWNPKDFTLSGMLGYTKGILSPSPASALTATINPYKAFADILDTNTDFSALLTEPLDSDLGRGVFTAGSANTRRYRLQFPMNPGPKVVFGYAVDVAWNNPSPNPPLQVPDDFPIEANQPEPFYVAIEPQTNTLYFDDEATGGGFGGGHLSLAIRISDWQGISTAEFQPQIASVAVAAPDLFDNWMSAAFDSSDATSAIYTIDLSGIAVPAHSGDTLIIARVVSNDGSTYKQTGAPGPSEAIKVFQELVLDIPNPDCNADTNNSFGEAVEIEIDDIVVGQVCLPGDAADYFKFNIPLGFIVGGEIILDCDAADTTVGLYDAAESLIDEDTISGTSAQINLAPLNLDPGLFYIKVSTANNSQVSPFQLALAAQLTNIAPTNPVEVTPSTLVVKPNRIWVHNQIAYMTSEIGCWIYDVSGTSAPTEIAYLPYGVSPDAAFYYPYLYYHERLGSTESRVNMIDFTLPDAPIRYEGVLNFDNIVADFAMNDANLYVAVRTSPTESEVNFYDYATSPLNPDLLGSTATSLVIDIMEILEKPGWDTHLAIGSIATVYTINVQNPSSPSTGGSYTLDDGYIKDIDCMGGALGDYFVMACDTDYDGDGYIYIARQTDDPMVDIISTLDTPGSAENVFVAGDYVLVGDGDAGLTTVNANDLENPVLLTSLPTKSGARDLDISGFICCVIPFDAGMQMIDITNPAAPSALYDLQVANSPTSLVINPDNELIMAEKAGTNFAIKILNIDIPAGAFVSDEYPVPQAPNHISLDSNHLAVAQDEGVLVLDVTDTSAITQVSEIFTGEGVASLYLSGDVVYIGSYPSNIYVYDISNPGSPSLTATLVTDTYSLDFTIHTGYLFACVGDYINIYSLADPLVPVESVPYYVGDPTRDTLVSGEKLFLVTNHNLEIFDASSPSSLSLEGSVVVEPIQWLTDIALEGYYAYVLGDSTAPYACSVWPYESPAVIGTIYSHAPYSTNFDILVSDGFLYEASSVSGLRIHDLY